MPQAFEPMHTRSTTMRELGLGFAYWLAFLLVLLPDNLLRASRDGVEISLAHEGLRIAAAAALGAAVTPIVLWLVRRYPLGRPRLWRHAGIHAAGAIVLALLLILASCVLAAWVFQGRSLPSAPELQAQLVSNWTLLTFALAALAALAHLFPPGTKTPGPQPLPVDLPAQPLTHVTVTAHGQAVELALSEVDWIETQGNYLGLHVGASTHLIRTTLLAFEAKLDPQHFVRVHRRHVVAMDRVVSLDPQTNGDALLRLKDGQLLRLSRSYRGAFVQRWRF